MCHSSIRPGTSYHVTQCYQAFPHVSTASDKCWGEKAWVRGYTSVEHMNSSQTFPSDFPPQSCETSLASLCQDLHLAPPSPILLHGVYLHMVPFATAGVQHMGGERCAIHLTNGPTEVHIPVHLYTQGARICKILNILPSSSPSSPPSFPPSFPLPPSPSISPPVSTSHPLHFLHRLLSPFPSPLPSISLSLSPSLLLLSPIHHSPHSLSSDEDDEDGDRRREFQTSSSDDEDTLSKRAALYLATTSPSTLSKMTEEARQHQEHPQDPDKINIDHMS